MSEHIVKDEKIQLVTESHQLVLKKCADDAVGPLLKRKLVVYLLVSIISFVILVLPTRAGVSVPIFVIIQAALMYYLRIRKTYIVPMLAVFILGLNAFLSANNMWRVANIFVAAALYGVMAVWIVHGISFKDNDVFIRVLQAIGNAFAKFYIPFKWIQQINFSKSPFMKRVFIGIACSIPAIIFVTFMLSRADMIFSNAVGDFFEIVFGLVHPFTVLRIMFGTFVGLYLFGIMCYIFAAKRKAAPICVSKVGDCVILNVVLISVLLVYTLFVAIQFRYLFAPSYALPYGLNFVTYARRGFFELLFLTGVNIVFILLAVWLTKTQSGRGPKLTKFLCMYLCAVTVVLLVSSFYRMWLYSSDDGLTRMRTLVFGFLLFELIGLVFTFFYIMKPKFNIVLVYCLIALCYYLVLNLVPIDRIIARDQINRYFDTGRGGISYVLSLSPDAAPEIARLLDSPNEFTRAEARFRLNSLSQNTNWRQWNLSRTRAARYR